MYIKGNLQVLSPSAIICREILPNLEPRQIMTLKKKKEKNKRKEYKKVSRVRKHAKSPSI